MSNTPAARNSVPRKDYAPVGAPGNPQQGQRCEGNTNCIPICPVQAKYSALKTWYELQRLASGRRPAPQLTATRSAVTIRSQAVATKVELDEHGRVSGITYQTYDDEETEPTRPCRPRAARCTSWPRNAIQNATLLLASGAANSSGLVGRNLMDHPLILTWGLTPEPVWGFRGPLSTSGLEMFRDGPFRSQSSAFRIEVGNEGWNFCGQRADLDGGDHGRAGRVRCRSCGARSARSSHGSSGWPWRWSRSRRHRTTSPSTAAYRDQLGNFRPVIRYDLPDYVRSGFAMAKEASDAMYRLLGVHAAGARHDGPGRVPLPGGLHQPTAHRPGLSDLRRLRLHLPGRRPPGRNAPDGRLAAYVGGRPASSAAGTTTTSIWSAAATCRLSAPPTRL